MSLLFISAPKSIIPATVTLHLPTHTPQLWLWLCVSRNSWPRLCVSQTGLGLCVCPVVDRLDFVLLIWFFWDQDSLPACSLFLPWPHLALLLSQECLHLLWFWPTCFLLWPAHQLQHVTVVIITSLPTPLFPCNSACLLEEWWSGKYCCTVGLLIFQSGHSTPLLNSVKLHFSRNLR